MDRLPTREEMREFLGLMIGLLGNRMTSMNGSKIRLKQRIMFKIYLMIFGIMKARISDKNHHLFATRKTIHLKY